MNFRLCFALMLGSLIGCSVESANNGGDVGENAVGSAKRIVADGSSTAWLAKCLKSCIQMLKCQ